MTQLTNHQPLRLLSQNIFSDTITIIIAVAGIILLILAFVYYCCKRKRGQTVEFEVFNNQASAPSSKDTKNNASGTAHVLGMSSKQSPSIKQDEDINTTSQSKKKRRRKKDRIQQHSSIKDEFEDEPPIIEEAVKKDADQSFDID